MGTQPARQRVGVSMILLIIAIVCFVLAALNVHISINLVDVGLAFFASSFLGL